MTAAVLPRSRYRQLGIKSTATVIVVDDDASIRGALAKTTQILGFDVLDFGSAESFCRAKFEWRRMPAVGRLHAGNDRDRTMPEIKLSGTASADDPDQRPRRSANQENDAPARIRSRAGSNLFDEKSLLRAIRKALPNH